MSDSQKLTIVGQCSGVMEKPSGWTEFQISVPGKQYPVKLSTKLPDLVEKGRAVKDQIATWSYSESDGSINPRSGQPYKNRYLEDVELGAVGQPQSASGTHVDVGPEPHHDPVHFADKDRLITRQTCLKAASSVYSGAVVSDKKGYDVGAEVLNLAERYEEWLYRDIDVEANAITKTQTTGASTAGGKTATGLTVPQSWADIKSLLMEYGDSGETWDMFERFGAAARHLLYGDEGLSPDQKNDLWQISVQAALNLREEVDAAKFPPPSEEDLTKAWASVLDGQELQPVAKKEVPDAP